MGGCGSKPKTKDADNEPYGAAGGAKTAAGAKKPAGKAGGAGGGTGGEVVEQKASIQQQQQQPVAAERKSSASRHSDSKDGRSSSTAAAAAAQPDDVIQVAQPVVQKQRKTSAEEPEASRARKDAQQSAAAAEQTSSEKKRPSSRGSGGETSTKPAADIEQRKSSTSKSPRAAELEPPPAVSTTTTAATGRDGKEPRLSGKSGVAVDLSDVSVTVSETSKISVSGPPAVAADIKTTSTSLTTKTPTPKTDDKAKPSTPLTNGSSSPEKSTAVSRISPERKDETPAATVGIRIPSREASPIKAVRVSAEASKPVPPERQTDIKSVNPEMQIFEALQKAKSSGVKAAASMGGEVGDRQTPVRDADSKAMTNGEAASKVEISAKSVEISSGQSIRKPEVKLQPDVSPVVAAEAKTSTTPVPAARASVEVKGADVVGPTVETTTSPRPASVATSGTASTPVATTATSPAATVSPTTTERRSIPRSVVLLSASQTPSSSPAASPPPAASPSPPAAAATTTVDGSAAHKQTPTVVQLDVRSNAKSEEKEKQKENQKEIPKPRTSAIENAEILATPKSSAADQQQQQQRTSRLPTLATSPTTPVTPASTLAAAAGPTPTPRQSSTTATSPPPSTSVPAATPATPVDSKPKKEPERAGAVASPVIDGVSSSSSSIKDLFIDLSVENRFIASHHHLVTGTRVRFLQTIDGWFTGEKDPPEDASGSQRVLAVHGRPGSGKTCLAAELCRRYAGKHQLAGSHFFHWKAVGLDHNRTVAVLQSLACRMCDQLPGYADALPERRTLERFLDAADPSELFDALISQPLQSIRRPAERRLIVIDAVDECDGADRDLLFQLLNSFELTTPDWLYVVVTLRDDNQLVARLDRVRAVELKSDATDAETMADVKRFFKEPMSRRIDRISLDGAQTQLAKNAEGNFLCATFLKDKLDSLPEDKKLAIRDLTLSFPVGFSETCRQSFQGLHERLTKGKKVPPGKESPYQRVVSLLVTAVEPLPKSAFGTDVEELLTQMNGTLVTSADSGSVSLSHRAVADWITSEQTPAPLGVPLATARQTMADALTIWIGQLGGEQDDGEGSVGASGKDVDEKLQEYALKHAVYHMTDAAKQHDNLAKVLCSLRYVEKKLKVPGVRLENLLADYRHSHYQTNPGTANLDKLVSLEAAMKRSSGLTEQIDLMRSFLVRRGSQLTRLGADFTLHLAANYPTVSRIQENARFDLGTRPWLEDVTAVADTPAAAVRSVRGTIVDVDVSPDQRTAAVVTRVDDFGALLYLLNASTGESTAQDPVDLKSALPDRVGLCVRFIQSTTGGVFFGSLSQFVSAKTAKIVDSGFDMDSVKLSDRYSIECSASAAGLLAVGVTTLPWGGRSLHAVVFDVATKKCTRTIELLKFRFGGSSHYGVKALALCGAADGGSLLCACVKQTNRSELKVSVYSTSKGELVASTDLDDESPTKCCFFGQQNQMAVLLGPAAHGRTDPSKETKRHSSASIIDRSKSFVWSFQQSGSKPVPMGRPNFRSLVHASSQQAVVAHRRSIGPSAIISTWKASQTLTSSAPPDKRFVVHGLGEAGELIATDKAVLFVDGSQLRFYNFQELPVVDDQSQFIAADICVDGISFAGRSDDPVVAFRPSTTVSSKISASALSLRAGDGISVGTRLFDPTETTSVSGPTLFPECIVGGPEVVAYSADGQCALLNVGYSVRVRDIHSGNQRELPGYGDLLGVPDGDRKVADQENNVGGSILACVVSPKDSVVGVVYGQQPHIIRLFDTKMSKTGKALHELTVPDAPSAEAAVTDFCFLPASSCSFVVSFHRKLSGGTLVVWNQKTGATVSREAGVDLGYFRPSVGTDRMALSVRSGGGGATNSSNAATAGIVLRSTDNHFNIRLTTAVTWSPEVGSSDVEFSGDGTVLVGLCCRSLRVWNSGNGESLRTFDVTSSTSAEIVGMPTIAHALLHDVTNERLLLVDVTSGEAVAAASTDGQVDRKWTARRLRVSPRGGVVAGATVDGSLRVYACRNMTSQRRQTTLQMIKTVTSPTKQPLQRQSTS